jgi:hypothetical protein
LRSTNGGQDSEARATSAEALAEAARRREAACAIEAGSAKEEARRLEELLRRDEEEHRAQAASMVSPGRAPCERFCRHQNKRLAVLFIDFMLKMA